MSEWPTDESVEEAVRAALANEGSAFKDDIRCAVIAFAKADPIFQAALALRNAGPSDAPDRAAERVIDAVNEAGL